MELTRSGVATPAALPLLLIFFFLPMLFLLLGFTVGHALGFSPVATMLLFYAILACSVINIPIYERSVKLEMQPRAVNVLGREYQLPNWTTRRSIVTVNVGGCVIPLSLSSYFLLEIPIVQTFLTAVAVTFACYLLARPITNIGIAVPMFVPVVVAIAAAWVSCMVLGGIEDLPRICFTAGVIGTIVGADLLHIRDVKDTIARMVSIGGAGTFDGIFLTGVFATLLSSFIT